MKKGQIIAIIVAVGVVAAVYLVDRTPNSNESVQESTQEQTEPESSATNLDAKVEEAVQIIQTGSQPPMVAVQLLREVIDADSNHIGANYWLGEFSMMSGQFDKAVLRFEKLQKLQPDNVETCIKLARAYQAAGNSTQAQDVLKEFISAHPDDNTKEQIAPVLEEISNS